MEVFYYKNQEYVGYSYNLTQEEAETLAKEWARVVPGVNRAVVDKNKEFVIPLKGQKVHVNAGQDLYEYTIKSFTESGKTMVLQREEEELKARQDKNGRWKILGGELQSVHFGHEEGDILVQEF